MTPLTRERRGCFFMWIRIVCELFFIGLAKVLHMTFGNHFGIMLMMFVIYDVEKEDKILLSDVYGFRGLGLV